MSLKIKQNRKGIQMFDSPNSFCKKSFIYLFNKNHESYDIHKQTSQAYYSGYFLTTYTDKLVNLVKAFSLIIFYEQIWFYSINIFLWLIYVYKKYLQFFSHFSIYNIHEIQFSMISHFFFEKSKNTKFTSIVNRI